MKTQIEESDLRSVLEALEESLGYVQEEAENAQRLYGQYPTRQARIQGLKDEARKHMDAITAIREALDEDQAHYKKVIDDVQALFEAKREEAAIWQAAYETEKGFREQEKQELASASVEPVTWKDEQGNVRMTLDAGEIQSSVGYVYSVHGERIKNACIRSDIPNGTPLYTYPPASKPWVGLTNNDLQPIADEYRILFGGWVEDFARAIEAKLKEKNNG